MNLFRVTLSVIVMRQFLAVGIVAVVVSGCGHSPAPRHSTEPKPTIGANDAVEPARNDQFIVHRVPEPDATCPLFFPPRDVGSVVRIPAPMLSLAMDPVMQALCSCTKPGEYGTVVARIDYGKGTVDMRADDSPAIDECLRAVKVTFTPPPPDDIPTSDCINCGPRYYGVFADSPPPPPKEALRLVYSFFLDRSNEVLDCPANMHAERGECITTENPAAPAHEKRKCLCADGDLKCAVACAAGK